jgi:predicted metallopeptidase
MKLIEAPDLKKVAKKLVSTFDAIGHVEVEKILFLREMLFRPKALARCYSFGEHPIGFYTDKQFAIVFYHMNCDYMTKQQSTILLLHELRHIGRNGKLIDHDVQDFRALLGINIDWAAEGAKLPDILKAGEKIWQRKAKK